MYIFNSNHGKFMFNNVEKPKNPQLSNPSITPRTPKRKPVDEAISSLSERALEQTVDKMSELSFEMPKFKRKETVVSGKALEDSKPLPPPKKDTVWPSIALKGPATISTPEKGTYTWIHPLIKAEYTGEWREGQLLEGRMIYEANGKKYEYTGQFKHFMPHGAGVMKCEETTWEADFEYGEPIRGAIISPQRHYFGSIKDWTMHGDGKLIAKEGTYTGKFSENKGFIGVLENSLFRDAGRFVDFKREGQHEVVYKKSHLLRDLGFDVDDGFIGNFVNNVLFNGKGIFSRPGHPDQACFGEVKAKLFTGVGYQFEDAVTYEDYTTPVMSSGIFEYDQLIHGRHEHLLRKNGEGRLEPVPAEELRSNKQLFARYKHYIAEHIHLAK